MVQNTTVVLYFLKKLKSMERKEGTLFGFIFLFNSIVKGIIDYLLIPMFIGEMGYLSSVLVTTIIYILIGILSVKIYDYCKKDYLLIEALKDAEKNNQTSELNFIIKLILKWSKKRKNKNILGLILASQNPGLVVIYYREGSFLYNGFAGKNMKIFFFINLLIVNVYWNTAIYTGVSIFNLFR